MISGLNLFFVWKYSPEKPRYLQLFTKPVIASALMGGAAWAVHGLVLQDVYKRQLQALQMMEEEYFVSPDRAALAVETGGVALRAARDLGKQDIAVYVGIPFCPTRCAYCSFVSQSVERSFALVPPYEMCIRDRGKSAKAASPISSTPWQWPRSWRRN